MEEDKNDFNDVLKSKKYVPSDHQKRRRKIEDIFFCKNM